jgi:competence protein ComEC
MSGPGSARGECFELKKLHTSWIVAWASLGLLAGVLLSLKTQDKFMVISWLAAGLSLLFVSLVNRRMAVVVAALIGGLILGLWRGGQEYPSRNLFRQYVGRQARISGKVSEDVSLVKDGQQQIKIKNVQLNGQALSGQVWFSTFSRTDIKRGDYVEASGQVGEGFGSFSATVYRAEINKVTKIKHGDIALELRDKFSSAVSRVLPQPQAALGIGFLTGQHTSLPESLTNNLRILGLTHIIVASGYNLTILVRFARRWLMNISKYSAALGSLLLIIGFMMVAGSSPSMNRAGIITGLSLAAWYYGRKVHPLVLLSFSAALTALVNPSYLWGDLGWYLSFAAFAGVLVLAPLLLDYFWGEREPNAVIRVVVETFSAQVLTAPIIAFAFGQYAPLALVSNVLILPFIPFAMIFVFIAGLAALLFSPIAYIVSYPAKMLLDYMTFVVDKLAALPIAQGEVNFPAAYLFYSYLLIVGLCIFLWRRTGHDFTEDSVVE